MRLGDLDALKAEFTGNFGRELWHYTGIWAAIDAAPTIDAVPVVHGRWIRRGNEKKCSVCGFIYYSNNDEWNGCPNCLAKMDGGGADGI